MFLALYAKNLNVSCEHFWMSLIRHYSGIWHPRLVIRFMMSVTAVNKSTISANKIKYTGLDHKLIVDRR